MAKGKIKSINVQNKFGFITPDKSGEDVHFSARTVRGEIPFASLQRGDEVEYEAEHNPRGMSAKWVKSKLPDSIYRFLNPYNFVRPLKPAVSTEGVGESSLLVQSKPPPHDRWIGMSGEIVCELTTQSPVFVADAKWWFANNDDKKSKHKSFRFFQIDTGNGKETVIPASSLRGMVRSIFEASTNSCFAHFYGNKRLSYRLDASLAPTLVPARAIKEKETGKWHLEIFSGTLEFELGDRPKGVCAAGTKRYCAISEEGTIHETDEEKKKIVPLNGLKHGDECYALVDKPKFTWEVKKLSKRKNDLHPVGRQKIFRGFLCINHQNIERKHKERFFIAETFKGNVVKKIDMDKGVVRDYEALLEEIQEYHKRTIEKWREDGHKNASLPKPKQENAQTKYEPAFSRHVLQKNANLKSEELVYAFIEKDATGPRVKWIAPVAIPRIWYDDVIANRMGFAQPKCESIDKLCPACRMFGWVEGVLEEDDSKQAGSHRNRTSTDRNSRSKMDAIAYRGRLRFSHASLTPMERQAQRSNATLAILGSPKPTTFRFYLRPRNGKPEEKMGHRPWEVNWNSSNMDIRGRKFYRHHNAVAKSEYERAGGKRDEQNRTVQGIIETGVTFVFEIRYENLAPVELGALLWSLELNEDMNHRLGFGKPLGFGSAKINVMHLHERNFNCYTSLDVKGHEDITDKKTDLIEKFQEEMAQVYGFHDASDFMKLENIQDMHKLLSDAQPEIPIHYPRSSPRPDPEGKNFEWFVGNNRQEGPGYLLPLAPDDTKGLPLLNKHGKIVR